MLTSPYIWGVTQLWSRDLAFNARFTYFRGQDTFQLDYRSQWNESKDSNEVQMTARDRSKEMFQKSKQSAEKVKASLRERTNKSETLQSAMDKIGVAGKWSWEKFGDAQRAVENKMKQYMGFDKYREELENSLEEALKVIAVQEERIRLLEIKQNGTLQ